MVKSKDNVASKLFYKASASLCLLLASAFVGATQYIGDPIECLPKNSDKLEKIFERHCWICGTEKITRRENQEYFNCITTVCTF